MRSLALVVTACLTANLIATPDLFDGFATGWRRQWRDQDLFTKPTRYETAESDGKIALHARSESANAGLLREVRLKSPTSAHLSWQWKISRPLLDNNRERERSGDDYAARICVIFETSLIPLRTRSIQYVWAAHEAAGAIYPSPYSRNVGMIVLRSGEAGTQAWQAERRDLLADYRAYFGESPEMISAVGVLVDTDNTGLTAEAWFSDLRLED